MDADRRIFVGREQPIWYSRHRYILTQIYVNIGEVVV